jgi:hypothetical protein
VSIWFLGLCLIAVVGQQVFHPAIVKAVAWRTAYDSSTSGSLHHRTLRADWHGVALWADAWRGFFIRPRLVCLLEASIVEEGGLTAPFFIAAAPWRRPSDFPVD